MDERGLPWGIFPLKTIVYRNGSMCRWEGIETPFPCDHIKDQGNCWGSAAGIFQAENKPTVRHTV